MAENSGISWTDHTFNPWIGCTKVGPGCDGCYAETLATTRLGVGWGDDAPRKHTAESTWKKVDTWNRQAEAFKAAKGHYPRVFTASLADIFDNKVDPVWRTEYWNKVRACPKLQFLIVTKRIPNVARMLPYDFDKENFGHVVLIITTVNQDEINRDVPRLLALKMKYPWLKIGLSIEPMLGPIDLEKVRPDATMTINALTGACSHLLGFKENCLPLDWVITGGETKQSLRIREPVELQADWIRDIDEACTSAGVPHHFKQWGHTIPVDQIDITPRDEPGPNAITYTNDGCHRAIFREGMGRMLDGREIDGFPPQ